MKNEIEQRLVWVKLYDETGDAGLVCRRCGISRQTLRKWRSRYQELGLEGLRAQSRRPKTSPLSKVGSHEESLILQMRQERSLGARRIQSELKRLHDVGLAMATIH